jgi:endonuclease G
MVIVPRLGPDVSAGGDSGSFWLDEETKNVVGLHFARGKRQQDGLAIDMPPILEALNVDIA